MNSLNRLSEYLGVIERRLRWLTLSRGAAVTAAAALALTVLAVLAADCVPVVLYDPVAHVLACAHAGWRGTVARTAAAAVAAMRSLGTRPADVIAGIGPAVAPDCYQIGPEVAEAATRAFGDRAPDVLRATGPGQWQFDLWMANRLVLTEAGIPGDQIQASNVPTGPIPATDPSGPISNTGFSGPITATDPSGSTGPAGGPFFSHRAERPCGRFAAMACLRARQALRPGEAR